MFPQPGEPGLGVGGYQAVGIEEAESVHSENLGTGVEHDLPRHGVLTTVVLTVSATCSGVATPMASCPASMKT